MNFKNIVTILVGQLIELYVDAVVIGINGIFLFHVAIFFL